MTNVTRYLKNQLEAVYDVDFIDCMDDLIKANNIAEQILSTTYDNADYKYLRICYLRLRGEAWREVHCMN